MTDRAYLILETGECFPGRWRGGEERAGEVVFNTSHSGYEEIATDPSYFSQIVVMTAPMQGNYGACRSFWESSQLWLQGFVCLQMQQSARDSEWLRRLSDLGIPVVDELDTRQLVLHLREFGTQWGALVCAGTEQDARERAKQLIAERKSLSKDWVRMVSRRQPETRPGKDPRGPRVAVIDFGCKTNILRELELRCSEIKIFPVTSPSVEIREWNPDGILLSNGPGDPADVGLAVETVQELLGWKFIFGICMGHQILGLALGARTFKLRFGHRGANHPVRDTVLNLTYVTSQNHGYSLDHDTLSEEVTVTHVNLNDNTISGIRCLEKKCMSVQFHPESHPGPHDAQELFDYFIKQLV